MSAPLAAAPISPKSGPVAGTVRPLQPQKQSPGTSTESPNNNDSPSLTQKQWIVPPRPKPGRKPATDTPATKRKAQNRLAQRAFRERKAAKIGELESQMDHINSEHAAEVRDLQAQIASLSQRLDQLLVGQIGVYHQDVHGLRQEVDGWRAAYENEKRRREDVERELAIINGEAVTLPRRNQDRKQHEAPPSYHTPEEIPLGCNKCSLIHCQCLEDAMQGRAFTYADNGTVKLSDMSARAQGQVKATKTADVMEIDSLDRAMAESTSTAPPGGGCGFCNDGSTCLCAELAAERKRGGGTSNLPSPPSDEFFMEIDFTNAFSFSPEESRDTVNTNCLGGPGSCEQCQRDPERAQFCKTLAASHAASDASHRPSDLSVQATVPCPAGAACCRFSTSANRQPANIGTADPVTISCAEAFNKLRGHPAFERARQDLDEWLPQLATVPASSRSEMQPHSSAGGSSPRHDGQTCAIRSPLPQQAATPSAPGRFHTAFEIETASILGVLRFFDRRFGRDAQ